MSLFCFLFIPAFALWRSTWRASGEAAFPAPGAVSGLALGLAAAFFRYSAGELFTPRGYGLGAFLAQLIDGAPFDALLPVLAYALIRRFGTPARKFDRNEAVNFALAWLVPVCAARAMHWSSVPDPVRLIAVPFLCGALAFSFPYWIGRIEDDYGLSRALAASVAALLPFAAAAATWAMLTHRHLFAFLLLLLPIAAAVPPLLETVRRRG